MEFEHTIELAGKIVDAFGVLVIIGGIALATAAMIPRLRRGDDAKETYRDYRHAVGRAILLGLEALVAADIIRTVAVSPTFESVGVLAVIVVIRTFLSFTLELELEGRWPWQQRSST